MGPYWAIPLPCQLVPSWGLPIAAVALGSLFLLGRTLQSVWVLWAALGPLWGAFGCHGGSLGHCLIPSYYH